MATPARRPLGQMHAIGAELRSEPAIGPDKEGQTAPSRDPDQVSTLAYRRPGPEGPIDDATTPWKRRDDKLWVGRALRICEIEKMRPTLPRSWAAA